MGGDKSGFKRFSISLIGGSGGKSSGIVLPTLVRRITAALRALPSTWWGLYLSCGRAHRSPKTAGDIGLVSL
jgi:hypothetical protein